MIISTHQAKDIRESLGSQHAYLNRSNPKMGQPVRTRIYDARRKRDGRLEIKVIMHRPNTFGHGSPCWLFPEPGDTVTIYAATPMEETIGGLI